MARRSKARTFKLSGWQQTVRRYLPIGLYGTGGLSTLGHLDHQKRQRQNDFPRGLLRMQFWSLTSQTHRSYPRLRPDQTLAHNRYQNHRTQSRYDECFGFSCIDLNVTLRLVLEVLPENENVIYNVTDLILRGYFHIEEDLVKYASNISSGSPK